jgi:hypothetical protein
LSFDASPGCTNNHEHEPRASKEVIYTSNHFTLVDKLSQMTKNGRQLIIKMIYQFISKVINLFVILIFK